MKEDKLKILFDSNVIIDALSNRNLPTKDSNELILKVVNNQIEGYIVAKQITDIYYVLRKYIKDINQRKIYIDFLLNSFYILPISKKELLAALNLKGKDYEDNVLMYTAQINFIDYIVTNNGKDFFDSKVKVITPKELNAKINKLGI